MKTYYCHEDFKPGITCLARTDDGRCMSGLFCICEHRSITPKYIGSPPPKPLKRRSTDCDLCDHKMTCALKEKFNKLKAENYPLVCECQHYKEYNPLMGV